MDESRTPVRVSLSRPGRKISCLGYYPVSIPWMIPMTWKGARGWASLLRAQIELPWPDSATTSSLVLCIRVWFFLMYIDPFVRNSKYCIRN